MGSDWLDTTSVYGPGVHDRLGAARGRGRRLGRQSRPGRTRRWPPLAALAAALLAGRLARRQAFAIALVGWNPLLAVHLAGGGHNDAWVGALILAALALSASRRLQAAGVLWVLAIGVKWVPILFLALRAAEARATGRRTGHRGFALAAAAVVVVATMLYGGVLAARDRPARRQRRARDELRDPAPAGADSACRTASRSASRSRRSSSDSPGSSARPAVAGPGSVSRRVSSS